jgi:hypothetical protein
LKLTREEIESDEVIRTFVSGFEPSDYVYAEDEEELEFE